MERTQPETTETAGSSDPAPTPAPGTTAAPAATPVPALPPGFTLTPAPAAEGIVLPGQVILRVLSRDANRALVTSLAFACVGVVGAGFWVGLLNLLGVRLWGLWPALPVLIGVAVLGGALAGARHLTIHASCSDPLCDGIPGAEDRWCPGCGREIVGTYACADGVDAMEGRLRSHLVRASGGEAGRVQ